MFDTPSRKINFLFQLTNNAKLQTGFFAYFFKIIRMDPDPSFKVQIWIWATPSLRLRFSDFNSSSVNTSLPVPVSFAVNLDLAEMMQIRPAP